jgi:peroxiredoxin
MIGLLYLELREQDMNRINSIFIAIICLVCTVIISQTAYAESTATGKQAPNFSLYNALGQQIALESFKGKTVVLEWFNPGCPFVRKFYSKGDMPAFQRQARDLGAEWLTISSSAPGKQGHIPASEAAATAQEHGINPAHLLLDPEGTVGRLYGAKTTPHIFVVDAKGFLAYAGAIDSSPSTSQSDIATATNYPLSAIKALARGELPAPTNTDAYGCSVKY